jgi:DNA-binding NtrC family response regulator
MNFSTTPLSKVPPTELLKDVNQDRPVVLVVDDDAVIADTLSLILNQFGFAAMTAYDVETALEIAAVIPPELLICEMAMPHMNGYDVATKITSTAPDCHVVLLSGRATSIKVKPSSAKENYEFVFLNKPFHPTVLLTEIAEPLKRRSRGFRTHLMPGEDIA